MSLRVPVGNRWCRSVERAATLGSWSRVLLSGLLCGLVLAGFGCGGRGGSSPRSGGWFSGGGARIDEIHLFGMPVAVNMGRSLGADGVVVRVFCNNLTHAKGLEIRQGTLELLLFDGTVSDTDPMKVTPLKTWTFPAAKVSGYANSSSLGVGYQFALNWEERRPRQGKVTVLARLTQPKGSILYSAPSVIPVAGR